MPLENFSRTLLDLYDAVGQIDPADFPSEVIQSIGKLVRFDGAMLATGCAAPNAGLLIAHACTHDRDSHFADDYAALTALDPVAQSYIAGLHEPLSTDCERLYDEPQFEPLQTFRKKYQFRKLLLHGDSLSTVSQGRWLVLLRNDSADFDKLEVRFIAIIWPHVSRAIARNLNSALARVDPENSAGASALINARGMIEAANPAFVELLQEEWPGLGLHSLPTPVNRTLLSAGKYRGRRIEIHAIQKFGYMACTARRTPLLDVLAPSELNVASRFATGMTHSQIAAHLKVSPSTVRNQLANVYLKLGIHSKVDLVRLMSKK